MQRGVMSSSYWANPCLPMSCHQGSHSNVVNIKIRQLGLIYQRLEISCRFSVNYHSVKKQQPQNQYNNGQKDN